jgi:hypothetical protein
MKKPNKITSLLSVSMLILSLNSASAQEKSKLPDLAPQETKDIIDLLRTCDSTLEKCQEAHKDKDKVIVNQDEQITVQRKRIEELEKADSSILNNKTFWFILGSIFTGVVYKLTR